ncbi:hypothetical protein SO802_001205 [Lithocarpus litseifolius]|uniref:Uncharacterized protein n=1 Tax=Lithocarpus litseifolius TaxID=425828 RepID=A0AAW2DZE4_9ROSI
MKSIAVVNTLVLCLSHPYFICRFMDHHRHYFCKLTRVPEYHQAQACQAGVIACNEMLHWVWVEDEEIKDFVVFDPFNDSEQCHYIHPPIELSPKHRLFNLENFQLDTVSFGVFQGRLQIFQFSHYP